MAIDLRDTTKLYRPSPHQYFSPIDLHESQILNPNVVLYYYTLFL